jgi:hypothetical protein
LRQFGAARIDEWRMRIARAIFQPMAPPMVRNPSDDWSL